MVRLSGVCHVMAGRVPKGKLARAEWKIYGGNIERLIVWNKKNRTPICVQTGNENSVSAPYERYRELRGKIAFSHNHPKSNFPPAFNDVAVDIIWNAPFSRVLGNDTLYEITAPHKGWNISDLPAFVDTVERVVKSHTGIIIKYDPNINEVKTLVPEDMAALIHEVFDGGEMRNYREKILPDILNEFGASVTEYPIEHGRMRKRIGM